MFQAHKLPCFAFAASLILVASVGFGQPVRAQSLGLGTSNDQTPVEVLADDGIEWMRDGKRFVARGNASAKRGDTTVFADTLTAHYRKDAHGKSQLWRMDADGQTRIVSPTATATGDTAVYDLDRAVLVLKGVPVAKLVTPDTVITAKEDLEYWEAKRMAVARGNAVVVRDKRTLRADLVTATFSDNSQTGKNEIEIVDAYGHVKITTPTETVTGDKGRYNVRTGIATVLNHVKLTRGTDTLNGAYAVVNVKTGVSTLYSHLPGASKGQSTPVRGKFTPKAGSSPLSK